MTDSVKMQWLKQYQAIQALHVSIMEILNTLEEQDDDLSQLNERISQQDHMIRGLPFAALSEAEIRQLNTEIEQLQYSHQLLTMTVNAKKQLLLGQSSQSKKAGRSIKAYQQAQDL